MKINFIRQILILTLLTFSYSGLNAQVWSKAFTAGGYESNNKLLGGSNSKNGWGTINQENNSRFQDFLEFVKGKDSLVDAVLNNQDKYRLQIIYGQVTHHSKDSVSVVNSSLGNNKYYYPASTIKLPCALLALEKLNELNIGPNHYFRIGNDFLCGNTSHISNSKKSKDSFYDIIKEMIVVSNNVSYNSVYEFLTPGYLKEKLREKDLNDIHLYKKFAGCDILDNLKCNSISFYDNSDRLLFKQDSSVLSLSEMAENYDYDNNKLIGSSFYKNGKNVKTPYDFNYNISASLEGLHRSLIDLIYPNTTSASHRWNILKADREFIIRMLGMFPRELNDIEYEDSTRYQDNLLKYIVFGDPESNSKMNKIRTFSKIGLSYGFTTEIAYVVDMVSKNECFLSVSIYTNQNKTINDGIYEYQQIAKPFLGKLGMLLLEYESKRIQPFTPDFSSLRSLYY